MHDPGGYPDAVSPRRLSAHLAHVSENKRFVTDALGVEIEVNDTVTVIHRGWGIRLNDCGRRATVTGFTRNGNVVVLDEPLNRFDATARGRALRPGCLAVARRDGEPGHEGNR